MHQRMLDVRSFYQLFSKYNNKMVFYRQAEWNNNITQKQYIKIKHMYVKKYVKKYTRYVPIKMVTAVENFPFNVTILYSEHQYE